MYSVFAEKAAPQFPRYCQNLSVLPTTQRRLALQNPSSSLSPAGGLPPPNPLSSWQRFLKKRSPHFK
jgi:hypothetical protein